MTARPPRKRTTPLPPPPVVDRAAVAGARALDDLLELHAPAVVGGMCRECMTEHPCRTLVLARIIADDPTAPRRKDTPA